MIMNVNILLALSYTFSNFPPATVIDSTPAFNPTTIVIHLALLLTKIAVAIVFRIISPVFVFYILVPSTMFEIAKILLT